MKKRLLLLIIAIMAAICMLFTFAACDNKKTDTSIENADSTNKLTHYEIDLNKANYEKYIKYSITETVANSLNKNGDFYDFKGVLSYAYYKDVIVTLSAQYTTPSWEGSKTYDFNFSIELDAAGNYSFYANNKTALDKLNWTSFHAGTTSKINVTAISGKVIFDI